MKVPKNSKYRTHKKSIKLTKKPNDRTGDHLGFSSILLAAKYRKKKLKGAPSEKLKNFRKRKMGILNSVTVPKNVKGAFRIFQHPLLQNMKQLKGALWDFFSKSLTMPKKLKGGAFEIFQHTFCRQASKKLKGGPLRKKFFRKISQCQKTERGTF